MNAWLGLRHWTYVVVRVADGGQPRAAEKLAQLSGEGFVPQADGMNNLSAIQFPHRLRVIRRVGGDWMCRNGNAPLPVHFVNRATGRLSPSYRVPDTNSEYVISD